MSSELQKYIETSIEKKENLLKAEVISFPNEKKFVDLKDLKLPSQKYWKLNDKSNDDQFKAVIGICFMFGTLFLMGLYSSLI